jgi:uncharacterized protein YcbK (DUF882 family)
LLAAAFAPQVFAQTPGAQAMVQPNFWNQPRWVWLKRPSSGEEIRTVYWADGALIQSEYLRLCWFLRDLRAGASMYMSPILLDMLYATSGWLAYFGMSRPIITTSGARFPSTNSHTEGAARNSLHQRGMAHDGYLPGITLESMTRLGIWLNGGGVGFYPAKSFNHWDTGTARVWRG